MTDENIIDVTPEDLEEVVSSEDENSYTPNDKIKVLVIGKGYMGDSLSKFLSVDSENIEVHTITRTQLDYLEKDNLINFINNYQEQGVDFTYVVNCVGFTGERNIDEVKGEPELNFYLNVYFPIMLGSICDELNLSLIHIGSGCIYNDLPYNDAEGNRINSSKLYREKINSNDAGGNDPTGWRENDIPNFGIGNIDSSEYCKAKHQSELLLTNLYNNVYALRIRLPFSEEWYHKSTLSKLLSYKNIVKSVNSATYLYDLHNFIYNVIISGEIPYGIYNITSNGTLDGETFIKVYNDFKDRLLEKELLDKNDDLDKELIELNEFKDKCRIVENRSFTILNNEIAQEAIGATFTEINEELLVRCFENLLENGYNNDILTKHLRSEDFEDPDNQKELTDSDL